MGWAGNLEPTYDIPTVISDNSDKVKKQYNLYQKKTTTKHRIQPKLVKITTNNWISQ